MSRRVVSDSRAATALSAFLQKHILAGTGNDNVPEKAAAFASRTGLSASRLSEFHQRVGGLPNLGTLQTLERGFFPKEAAKQGAAYAEWQQVLQAIRDERLPREDIDQKRFNLRQAWDLLMRPLAGRVIPIVRSAIDGDDAGVLRGDQIQAGVVDAAFVLPMPAWFVAAIADDHRLSAQYDLHEAMDFAGSPTCDDFYGSVPAPNFREIVAYHADAYARHVLEALRRRPAYPPYNKQKLGLYGYQQGQRTGAREGTYLDLDFYRTDYHTHRVMRRVLHDLRASHPALFLDDPDLFGTLPHLRYFTTSFGMNVVATTQDRHGRRFYMARLSNRQGNSNQQALWHITANEGLNLDDVQDSRVSMESVVNRALHEEIGVALDDADQKCLFLEFAIDQRNFEPFLSCLVHLPFDRETLHHRKQHLARDDRREFQEMRDFPFSEQAIIQLLLDEPGGAEGFTSYSLNILDSILVRNLAPRVSR